MTSSGDSITDSARETRDALTKHLLDAHEREYDRLVDTWKSLESKAQATVAIAGIFVGLALGIAKDLTKQGHTLSKLMIFVITVLLSFAVERAVRALKTRDIEAAPSGTDMLRLVTELLAVEDQPDFPHRLSRFYENCASQWTATLVAHREANEWKAERIAEAQLYLLIAVFGAALLVAWTIVDPA